MKNRNNFYTANRYTLAAYGSGCFICLGVGLGGLIVIVTCLFGMA
jgi:hypothetical protein